MATSATFFNTFLEPPSISHQLQGDDTEDSDGDAGVSLLVNDDLDDQDEEGWNDIDGAEEQGNNEDYPDQVATCPICEKEFLSSQVVFGHLAGKEETDEGHGFDLKKYVKEKGLDYYGAVKLVNYLRTAKTVGELQKYPREMFLNEEKYLQPVVEDDPLLLSLGDLLESDEEEDEEWTGGEETAAEKKLKKLKEQLSRITAQFEEYKNIVRRNFERELEERINNDDWVSVSSSNSKGKGKDGVKRTKTKKGDEEEDIDEHYFKSYAGHDIHETMLRDTVRTDSYRDFIYQNKHLFKDRTVLDIGCGTGILSMFCARAGAKKVYAVDNSAIIEKARLNVYENNLQDVISCIKGKIEEVTLPTKQVDIIISEWMGYCLLYEAMLDSVIFARDKYLKPDGLMVPSYTTLLLSPLHSHDLVNEKINFWNDVYGFKMNSMKQGICEDVIIDCVLPSQLASDKPAVFKVLDLHRITVQELTFNAPFEVEITKDLEEVLPLDIAEGEEDEKRNSSSQLKASGIHGFLLWFDTFFTTSRSHIITTSDRAESWKHVTPDSEVGVSFTTGPFGQETHWKQGALMVDVEREKKHASESGTLKTGDKVFGSVTYRKRKENSRELEIEVEWRIVKDGIDEKVRRQMWLMR